MNSEWILAVRAKYARKNKILFDRQSECLQELLVLISQQRHRTLVMWALEWATKYADILKERHISENRIYTAIIKCRKWAQGEIKMPEAKKAILDSHAAAKIMDSASDAALCHAVGQACATVHVETHAIGLAFYDLSAIVFEKGIDNCVDAVENRINEYIESLKYWERNVDKVEYKWAEFLLDDTKENKEKLLMDKTKRQH
ncbi:MAG: hypothetical protein JXN65_07980 [Clostridia bacterium]|nr:hypothetical protein [Clostridia bacterium]